AGIKERAPTESASRSMIRPDSQTTSPPGRTRVGTLASGLSALSRRSDQGSTATNLSWSLSPSSWAATRTLRAKGDVGAYQRSIAALFHDTGSCPLPNHPAGASVARSVDAVDPAGGRPPVEVHPLPVPVIIQVPTLDDVGRQIRV